MHFIVVLLGFSFGLMNTGLSEDIIGEWTYKAPTAPAAYQEGEIHISKSEQDTYEVEIVIGQYIIPAKNIKWEEEKLSFMIIVDGAYVDLSLTFKDGKLMGNANTPDGLMMIEGKRKKTE